jgi:hypothetical protein
VQHNLLEAWRYDEQLILSASQQEILDVVNLLQRRCCPLLAHSSLQNKGLGHSA